MGSSMMVGNHLAKHTCGDEPTHDYPGKKAFYGKQPIAMVVLGSVSAGKRWEVGGAVH